MKSQKTGNRFLALLYFLWLLPPAQCGIYGVLHLPQPYDFLPEWLVLRRQFGILCF